MTAREQVPSKEIVPAYEDDRPILCLQFSDTHRSWDIRHNCFEIRAYKEPGEYSYKSFFAIIGSEGQIMARVPASHVEVRYAA